MKRKDWLKWIGIIVVIHLAGGLGPWWMVLLITLAAGGFLGWSQRKSFLMTFLAVFLVWFVYSIWLNQANSFMLSNKLGVLFGGLGSWGLMLVGALVMAFLGGLTGWIGAQAKELFD